MLWAGLNAVAGLDNPGSLAIYAEKKIPESLRLEEGGGRGLVWMGEGQTSTHHRVRVWASPLPGAATRGSHREEPLGPHFQATVPGIKSPFIRNVWHGNSGADGTVALITCC